MRHNPAEFVLMEAAHVIAGCDTESVNRLFFSKESALPLVGDFSYVAFFDKDGNKLDEVRVDVDATGAVVFEDAF